MPESGTIVARSAGLAPSKDLSRSTIVQADPAEERVTITKQSTSKVTVDADTLATPTPQLPQKLELRGRQGKTVIVDGATIRIIKEGWLLASRREKALPIRNISSVEVKEPGVLIAGFIQFSIAGGIPRDSSFTWTGGAFDAAQDENSVLFAGQEAYQTALRIKEYVETYQERPPSGPPSTSAADEILKLKALMDQGIISREEFETKKRRLIES